MTSVEDRDGNTINENIEKKTIPTSYSLVAANKGGSVFLDINPEELKLNSLLEQGELVEKLAYKMKESITKMKDASGRNYSSPDEEVFEQRRKEIMDFCAEIAVRVGAAEFGIFWKSDRH